MQFNKDQEEAYKKIHEFYKYINVYDEKGKYFLLDGMGGSGKTYVISHSLQTLKKRGIKYAILAPTHKACGVLSKSLPKENVQTVAKYIGFSEHIDEDGNKIVSYGRGHTKFREKLLIIDECSMIDSKQLEILVNMYINILFVGDICQLNPIGENVSEVFGLEFYDSAHLTKNERVVCRHLGDTILEFRNAVIQNRLSASCVDNDSRIESRDAFNNSLINSFLEGKETVFIAWTNMRVTEYNTLIRKKLFGNDVERFVKGEKLTINRYYRNPDTRVKMYTSTVVNVASCDKAYYNLLNPTCTCKGIEEIILLEKADELFPRTNSKCTRCDICHTPTSMVSHKIIRFWEIVLKEYPTEVFLVPCDGMTEIYPIVYKHKEKCKKLRSAIMWKLYYNFLEKLNAPLDYIYAITAHKSQGSGYDNVFVDVDNINFCINNHERLRLIYTAISRAQKSLTFIKN